MKLSNFKYRDKPKIRFVAYKTVNMKNNLHDYSIIASNYFRFLRVKEIFDRKCVNRISNYKFNMLKPITMISNFDDYKTIRSVRDGKIYKRYNI